MTDPVAPNLPIPTFSRDEVEAILDIAAKAEERTAPRSLSEGEAQLTLADIQAIGAEAGIDPQAIASASVRVALATAGLRQEGLQHTQVIAGELGDSAWDELYDTVRSTLRDVALVRGARQLEFEIKSVAGHGSRLLVSIRSRGGVTTVSIWSDAPHLSAIELASCGVLGMPVALFPIVASSGGLWPGLSAVAGLAGAGALAGAGVALLWQRWAQRRWQARVQELVVPLIARTAALAEQRQQQQ